MSFERKELDPEQADDIASSIRNIVTENSITDKLRKSMISDIMPDASKKEKKVNFLEIPRESYNNRYHDM